MTNRFSIVCDRAELAVECACAADALALPVEPLTGDDAVAEAVAKLARGEAVAVALAGPARPGGLVELAVAAEAHETSSPVALVGPDARAEASRDLGRDLGLPMVSEVAPLVSILALQSTGAQRPWTASTRALPDVDRLRLAGALGTAERGGGRLGRLDGERLGYATGRGELRAIGAPRDVAEALSALRAADVGPRPPMPTVEGVDPQAVLDVIFGPPRSLSDPASKAALEPYDLPLPVEELCTSPSRAAAEAARIGFPVRIALASPDLRVWDHPDLAADGVDNAARVRDVYRQVMALARVRAPDARLLGVMVGATTAAQAALRVHARPLPHGLVLAEIGFADPHGVAAEDRTRTVLPASTERIEHALGRLRGSRLLLGGGPAERRDALEALADVLLRIGAFVNDWRAQVVAVEIDPLAVVIGGGVEVREACVEVGDAFVRSLQAPAGGLSP